MPYIGKQLVRGQNRKLDDISSGFNGSLATFTLQVASQNVTVGSALQLWISLGGVVQEPLTDYTVAGNQITFTTAPAASLDFFGVIQGDVTDTNTPGDATVTTSKLATGLTVNLADGSAATSSLQLGGTDSGLFSSAADKVNVTTGGAERLEIGDSEVVFNDPSNDVDFRVESNGNTHMLFVDAGNDRVGIGESSPAQHLHVNSGTTDTVARFESTDARARIHFVDSSGESRVGGDGNDIAFYTSASASEKMRINNSGQLLIGATSSSSVGADIQAVGDNPIQVHRGDDTANGPIINLTKSRNTAYGSNTIVQDGDTLGNIRFRGDDGGDYNSTAAIILAAVDGTPGSNDMPGRLVFSTTPDGSTTPTERLRIDSSGNVGIGTTSPGYKIEVTQGSGNSVARFTGANSANLVFRNATSNVFELNAGGGNDELSFGTAGNNERIRIDSSGNVGIGVSNPGDFNANAEKLVLANGGDDVGITLDCDTDKEGSIYFADGSTGDNLLRGQIVYNHSGDSLRFVTNASERVRVDGSGRLLINTTTEIDSSTATGSVHMAAAGGGKIYMMRNDGTTETGNDLGMIRFYSNDGTEQEAARIEAEADGNHGTDDKPGRLVFMTTADGGSSPTERWRINENGTFTNKTSNIGSVTGAGVTLESGGTAIFARSSANPVFINRITNDGNLVQFYGDNTLEGNIAINGTTVSYNGAHLSRWSQLASGAERVEILRGSVLSNLDEMCVWGEEDNEQLNRMKVSDVEGDPNVAGVFQAWDDDDDTYTNDFYCAMTGDFVIRIAQGTTVARGDLLMSAGDGTAKPQDDDIVRSKTIAKVTSTAVSTTYSDGSYCVPCVLMAC